MRKASLARRLLLTSTWLAACSSSQPPRQLGPRCVAHETSSWVSVTHIDPVDVLFVIADTPSMAEEQALLAHELPAIVQGLITGNPVDGQQQFDKVDDLHLGVVSATFADGGSLHRVPAAGGDGCASEYPSFLSFHGDYFEAAQDDPAAFEQSVQCVTELGAASDAPNQALEATLQALTDSNTTSGFLRNDPAKGLSLILVIVVADTDDCSATNAAVSSGQAPTTSAACAAHSEALQPLDRYFDGLRALRKGNENLVLFGVIGGIPPALAQLGKPGSTPDLYNAMDRAAFYTRILDDSAMQPTPDPAAPERLLPACSRGTATAEPARRLTSLAERFGGSGLVTSICEDHLTAILRLMPQPLARQLGAGCVPRAFPRGADGRIPCKVIWDLPPPELAPEGTPTQCSDRPYLTPAPGKPKTPGGQRCEVAQAAVTSDAELAAAGPNAGFYYDDFSLRTREQCIGMEQARILFTDYARPQSGVTVELECFELEVAATGDAAVPDAGACEVAGTPEVPWVNAQSVGRRCMPAVVPDGGFAELEVWIESAAKDCGTGVCMAYHFQGDPRPSCVPIPIDGYDPLAPPPTCATEDEIEARLYCSCRCHTADWSTPACVCPNGFSCREVLNEGGPALEGGYCVKDGTEYEWP